LENIVLRYLCVYLCTVDVPLLDCFLHLQFFRLFLFLAFVTLFYQLFAGKLQIENLIQQLVPHIACLAGKFLPSLGLNLLCKETSEANLKGKTESQQTSTMLKILEKQ
jgi:hypothetical protein